MKAAGAELNARTPELFRHEIAVMQRLPSVDYRPDLLAAYDDGSWVAMLLEDVDGRHPDLDVAAEADAVRAAVREQAQALATSGSSLGIEGENLADRVRRWHRQISSGQDGARAALPQWWLRDEQALSARVASLADRVAVDAWCHFDIRDDNLLIRPDGRAVILDWGMSCAGVSWLDELLLDLHAVDRPEFDGLVAGRLAYPDSDDLEADTTDMLLALGGSLAVQAARPQPPGLPVARGVSSTRVAAHPRRRAPSPRPVSPRSARLP